MDALTILPSEEEQEARWVADICVLCGAAPIAGESVSARYCSPECRKTFTRLARKAART